jgi:hypothetical protein
LRPWWTATCSSSELKAPQIKVFTPFCRSTFKRSRAGRSGNCSSCPGPAPASSGKMRIREHQFNTGATRARITGMAIIPLVVRGFPKIVGPLATSRSPDNLQANPFNPILKQILCQLAWFVNFAWLEKSFPGAPGASLAGPEAIQPNLGMIYARARGRGTADLHRLSPANWVQNAPTRFAVGSSRPNPCLTCP